MYTVRWRGCVRSPLCAPMFTVVDQRVFAAMTTTGLDRLEFLDRVTASRRNGYSGCVWG